MQIKVSLNNLRTAPRKTRAVADLIRNKKLAEARAVLEFTIKRSGQPILKLLNSAVASALHDFKLEESNLYVSKITVDEGPKLKRSHPMSRGRAYPIYKRTSHITLVLSELNQKKEEIKRSNVIKVIRNIKKKKVEPRKNKNLK